MYCLLVLLQRLAAITAAVPGLGPHSRVLDVGSGTGCLLPHLQARGVADILAVDLSAMMLEQLQKRFPPPSTCGNDPGVDQALCNCVLQHGTPRHCKGATSIVDSSLCATYVCA